MERLRVKIDTGLGSYVIYTEMGASELQAALKSASTVITGVVRENIAKGEYREMPIMVRVSSDCAVVVLGDE